VGELREYARRCKAIDLLRRGSRFAADATAVGRSRVWLAKRNWWFTGRGASGLGGAGAAGPVRRRALGGLTSTRENLGRVVYDVMAVRCN